VPGFDRETFARCKDFDLSTLRRESQKTAAALFLSADPQVSDCWLHRDALPVDGITICPLMAACDFDKSAAHR